jgi:hypothetical protein
VIRQRNENDGDQPMTTKLHLQIEEMRARLADSAEGEQKLLRALAQALERVDRKLIYEVRQVTAGHAARRVAILAELQVLAERLCTFPAPLPRAPIAANDGAPTDAAQARTAGTHALGDWRLAASNIDDDLDLYREDVRRTG